MRPIEAESPTLLFICDSDVRLIGRNVCEWEVSADVVSSDRCGICRLAQCCHSLFVLIASEHQWFARCPSHSQPTSESVSTESDVIESDLSTVIDIIESQTNWNRIVYYTTDRLTISPSEASDTSEVKAHWLSYDFVGSMSSSEPSVEVTTPSNQQRMNGLSFSELCCLFCCPPCPARIAAKLAFLPPEPTYNLVPDSTNTKFTLTLTERAEWQYTQRELDSFEVFYSRTNRGNRIACESPHNHLRLLFLTVL